MRAMRNGKVRVFMNGELVGLFTKDHNGALASNIVMLISPD